MKLSARNILAGTVVDLNLGNHSAIVTIGLSEGQTLTAVVTASTVARLGLAAGTPVHAIFKAPSVILKPIVGPDQGGGLTGTIVVSDPVSDELHMEVAVALPDGRRIYALLRNEVARTLGLEVGLNVRIMVPASVVIIGVDEDDE